MIKQALTQIEAADVFFVLGIGFLGVGLWWLKPWVSFSTVGAILIIYSLLPTLMSYRSSSGRQGRGR